VTVKGLCTRIPRVRSPRDSISRSASSVRLSCAKAGSALVILAEDGTIYWPIAETTPSSGQNPKLLRLCGRESDGKRQSLTSGVDRKITYAIFRTFEKE
jgi:hypothetical protein